MERRSGSEVSLADFRKDIYLEFYNEAGQLVIAYKIYRCWVSEYQAMPDLDANANAIAIEHIKLENEGFERDTSVTEPAGADAEHRGHLVCGPSPVPTCLRFGKGERGCIRWTGPSGSEAPPCRHVRKTLWPTGRWAGAIGRFSDLHRCRFGNQLAAWAACMRCQEKMEFVA